MNHWSRPSSIYMVRQLHSTSIAPCAQDHSACPSTPPLGDVYGDSNVEKKRDKEMVASGLRHGRIWQKYPGIFFLKEVLEHSTSLSRSAVRIRHSFRHKEDSDSI